MVDKTCVICDGTESEGEVLLQAPCRDHYVCTDDIGSFFERAAESESLFPPKCCEQMFILDDYEEHVPFDIAWQYRVKEQGEYAILAKEVSSTVHGFRVYCGNPKCTKFLHPSSHITDDTAGITYAICEDEACGKFTCIGCRLLLENGIAGHVCKKDENEEAFKQEVTAKGYQLCSVCNTTIELIEACNHITCECGHDFCYVCGKEWLGLHACPHYGPPKYDSDGYNQDGYHRDTGLNRDGLTRRQDLARRRGENPDEMDEDEDIREEDDPDWEVLQHLSADQRRAVNALPEDARDEALDGLRIELFETRGLVFGPGPEADEDFRGEDQVDEEGEDEAQETGEEQVQQALDELFDVLHPMINDLPDLPIGHPGFPQAMRDALAEYTPQHVQEFLALLDDEYDLTTHTLTVDFDRERIRSVAQQLIDRAVGIGGPTPGLDDMERLILAVLPHVIIRANEPHRQELGGDGEPGMNEAAESATLQFLTTASNDAAVAQHEAKDEDDHEDLYAHPDDPPRRAHILTEEEARQGLGRALATAFLGRDGDDSSSADDESPQTPEQVMQDVQGPHADAERGEATVKAQGPPGGWPEVDEELD